MDEEYRRTNQYFPSPGEVEHDPLEIADWPFFTSLKWPLGHLEKGTTYWL